MAAPTDHVPVLIYTKVSHAGICPVGSPPVPGTFVWVFCWAAMFLGPQHAGVSPAVKKPLREWTALLPALCQLINDLLPELATNLKRGGADRGWNRAELRGGSWKIKPCLLSCCCCFLLHLNHVCFSLVPRFIVTLNHVRFTETHNKHTPERSECAV